MKNYDLVTVVNLLYYTEQENSQNLKQVILYRNKHLHQIDGEFWGY